MVIVSGNRAVVCLAVACPKVDTQVVESRRTLAATLEEMYAVLRVSRWTMLLVVAERSLCPGYVAQFTFVRHAFSY